MGTLGSAAKLGVLPGGRVCAWVEEGAVARGLSPRPWLAAFHGLDLTVTLSAPGGVLSALLASPSPSFYSSPEGSRGPSGHWCVCGKAQPLEAWPPGLQRAMGRKQEDPGGLRPQVGSLPRLRPLAFLLGCHQSCRVLMSLGLSGPPVHNGVSSIRNRAPLTTGTAGQQEGHRLCAHTSV